MDDTEIKHFLEAALLAAGRPMSVDQLQKLFDEDSEPEKSQIREAIGRLQEDYEPRGIVIAEVASGFRTQVRPRMAERLQKLWEERPPRYSRALFETLALIAYRQPMTRGEIEEVRGVAVSTNIIRTLLEREWVRVVGHRDVPGRPAMFGTTRQFLDYFGLKKLDELPPLADLSDWESLRVQLNLPSVENEEQEQEPESADVTELPVLHIGRGEDEVEISDGTASEGEGATAAETEAVAERESLPEGEPAEHGEDAAAASEENRTGFEEIVATEWPKPDAAVRITVAEEQPDDNEKDNENDDQELAPRKDRNASVS